MKTDRGSIKFKQSKGFSLVELMISMTIGIIMIAACMSVFLASTRATRITEAQVRLNEDAQAALNILSQQIRMAGFNGFQPNRSVNSLRNPVYDIKTTHPVYPSGAPFNASSIELRGCDGQLIPNIAKSDTIANLDCLAGSTSSIAVSYEADKYNTVPDVNGFPTDCLGNKLPSITVFFADAPANAPVTYAVADNRFYIDYAKGAPGLYCRGNGGNEPQSLVDNVEDIKFLYGISGNSSSVVAGYLTATDIANLTISPEQQWGKVLSVRICILMRSEVPVVANQDSARYINCNGELTTVNDLRLRHAYSTTIALKNRLK